LEASNCNLAWCHCW